MAIAAVTGVVVLVLIVATLAGRDHSGQHPTSTSPGSEAPGGVEPGSPQPAACDPGTGHVLELDLIHLSTRIDDGWTQTSDVFFTWDDGQGHTGLAAVFGFPPRPGLDATASLMEFLRSTSDTEGPEEYGQASAMTPEGALTSAVLLPFSQDEVVSGVTVRNVGAYAAAVRPEGLLILKAYSASLPGQPMPDETAEELGRFLTTAVDGFGC